MTVSTNVGWTPEPWNLPDNLDMQAVAALPWGQRLPLDEAISLLAFGNRAVDRERWGREIDTFTVAAVELFDLAMRGAVEIEALSSDGKTVDPAIVPPDQFRLAPMRPFFPNSFEPFPFSPRHGDLSAQMEARRHDEANPRKWTKATVSVDGLRNWLEQKVAERDGDERPYLPFWQERSVWPSEIVEGHYFFTVAVDRVGRRMFPSGWTGREADGLRLKHPILFPLLPPTLTAPGSAEESIVRRLLDITKPPTAEEWAKARRMQQELREGDARFKQVVSAIVEACQSGRLAAALAPQVKAPESVTPCPVHFWHGSPSDMALRIHFCRLNPSDPFRQHETEFARPTYNWIYLNIAGTWQLEETVEPTCDTSARILTVEPGRRGRPPSLTREERLVVKDETLRQFNAPPFAGGFGGKDRTRKKLWENVHSALTANGHAAPEWEVYRKLLRKWLTEGSSKG